MSYRKLPNTSNAMKALLGEMLDRLERLEKGSAIGGVVSFGPTVQVGGVQIKVTKIGAGPGLTLTFKNLATGSTNVVSLP